jgi:lysophospholipase L1-like esterase
VSQQSDDSLMNRFDEHGLRCFRARDAILATAVAALLLVLFEGGSIRTTARRMPPGIGHDLVGAVGEPAGWLADQLPLARVAHDATAWLSPDDRLAAAAGFDTSTAARSGGTRPPQVDPEAFDPVAIGSRPPPRRPLRTLLVTGDSLSTPLDTELARSLAGSAVDVIRDPHLGTGISKTFLVDWGQLSTSQVRRDHPDAVVVFVGANEGFPMAGPGGKVRCCGADWAAVYATRVREMADTYRQRGAARVYWITLPAPRDPDRQRISRVVNAAIEVATEPWRAQVRVIDTVPVFTPHGYRDAMPVGGRPAIVREADGIHLNRVGAKVLSDLVLRRMGQDFVITPGGR